MKYGPFFLFFLMILGQSCTNHFNNVGFITLKPGHFCKVGSIVIVDGTIFIAGSFIAVDNPDAPTPLRQSYIASIDTSGALNWEIANEEPDYTHWEKLVTDGLTNVYAIGSINSPFSSGVATYAQLNSYNSQIDEQAFIGDSILHKIIDVRITEDGSLALLNHPNSPNTGPPCITKWVMEGRILNDEAPMLCADGIFNTTQFVNDQLYLAAWGNLLQTTDIYFVNDTGTPLQLPIPETLDGLLVNDFDLSPPFDYVMATTVKNALGPCLYQFNERDSITEQICLDYWPLHGSTIIKELGACTLLAFNATDTVNGNAVHVVITDASNKVSFEETIKTPGHFVLNDLAVYQSKIYLAGTLETEGEGSSMAVKIIPIPVYTNCGIVN